MKKGTKDKMEREVPEERGREERERVRREGKGQV